MNLLQAIKIIVIIIIIIIIAKDKSNNNKKKKKRGNTGFATTKLREKQYICVCVWRGRTLDYSCFCV